MTRDFSDEVALQVGAESAQVMGAGCLKKWRELLPGSPASFVPLKRLGEGVGAECFVFQVVIEVGLVGVVEDLPGDVDGVLLAKKLPENGELNLPVQSVVMFFAYDYHAGGGNALDELGDIFNEVSGGGVPDSPC